MLKIISVCVEKHSTQRNLSTAHRKTENVNKLTQ